MKYKTPEDVRIALGLQPWREFEISIIQKLITDTTYTPRQKAEFIVDRRPQVEPQR